MESIKKKYRNLPLRSFFIITVCITVGIVALLSALIIWGCVSFRNWLLPDSNAAYLTIEKTYTDGSVTAGEILLRFGEEPQVAPWFYAVADGEPVLEDISWQKYSLVKLENTYDALTPKRKIAYQFCGIVMVAAPAVLAFAGILLCSLYFYQYKLKHPLKLLSDAMDRIAGQDLDFGISYDCGDEMGRLCCSFEDMRAALEENYKAMWGMLEERKLMQASIAHDLRNPIAIIQGYTEYLENGLENGEIRVISREKLGRIVKNLGMAAKRLELYTESVRMLNQSEEMVPDRQLVFARKWMENVTEDLGLLAGQSGIILSVRETLEDREIWLDSALVCRILENVMNNALRFAKEKIEIDFSLSENTLFVTVTDDGGGFAPEILNKKDKYSFSCGQDGHFGIGLAVSRLLAQKHGGGLELSNSSSGACVKLNLCLTKI